MTLATPPFRKISKGACPNYLWKVKFVARSLNRFGAVGIYCAKI